MGYIGPIEKILTKTKKMSEWKCSYKACECNSDAEKYECDLAYKTKKMSKQIILSQEELEKEISQAFIHGQGNAEMMESGLERDERKDYVNSRIRHLLNKNK